MAPAAWVIEYAVVLTLGGVIGGPLGEEPGWRGFALPRLQAQLGPLAATLLLGVLWAGWHFPQFLMPEWADQNGGVTAESVSVFVATVMAICVIMTWIFNHTRGSILLVMIAHSEREYVAGHARSDLSGAATSDIAGLIGFGIVAVALVVTDPWSPGIRGTRRQVRPDAGGRFGSSLKRASAVRSRARKLGPW